MSCMRSCAAEHDPACVCVLCWGSGQRASGQTCSHLLPKLHPQPAYNFTGLTLACSYAVFAKPSSSHRTHHHHHTTTTTAQTMDEGPPPPPPPQSKEIVDITDKIAKSECFVLNAVCFGGCWERGEWRGREGWRRVGMLQGIRKPVG